MSIKTLMTKGVWVDLGLSAFCLLFSLVYAQFSHGVNSPYMSYLFAYPLLFGAIVLIGMHALALPKANDFSAMGYNFGLAAITLSSLLTGIFEIAGTSSVYAFYLMLFGEGLMVLATLVYMVQLFAVSKKSA